MIQDEEDDSHFNSINTDQMIAALQIDSPETDRRGLSSVLNLPTVGELVKAKTHLIRKRMPAQGRVRLSKHILKNA